MERARLRKPSVSQGENTRPGDPATKAKSVVLTEEGVKLSQDLFEKYFTKST